MGDAQYSIISLRISDAKELGPDLTGAIVDLLSEHGIAVPGSLSLIPSFSAAQLAEIESFLELPQQEPGECARFESLYRLRVRHADHRNLALGIADVLGRWDRVKDVYIEPARKESSPMSEMSFREGREGEGVEDQPYLGAGSSLGRGVNARYAWCYGGGRGERSPDKEIFRFIHIDVGWDRRHDALGGIPIEWEAAPVAPRYHGTAALSIVGARQVCRRTGGVRRCYSGIAPEMEWVGLVPYGDEVHPALVESLKKLRAGDVVLVEAQSRGPVELSRECHELIKCMVSRGVIVIQPTGNGRDNLDELLKFPDSGSIIVGGATWSEDGWVRRSMHGRRVNCFAWSDWVWAAGKDGLAGIAGCESVYGSFANTSAASAIIAGVAIVVQSLSREHRGELLMPSRMRSLLGCNRWGTVRETADGDNIGPMPDLKKIVDGYFGLVARST